MMMLLTAWSRVAERFWPGFRKFQGFLSVFFSFCLVYVSPFSSRMSGTFLPVHFAPIEIVEKGARGRVEQGMCPEKQNEQEIWILNCKYDESSGKAGWLFGKKEDQFWADLDLVRDSFFEGKGQLLVEVTFSMRSEPWCKICSASNTPTAEYWGTENFFVRYKCEWARDKFSFFRLWNYGYLVQKRQF